MCYENGYYYYYDDDDDDDDDDLEKCFTMDITTEISSVEEGGSAVILKLSALNTWVNK